jgi:DNA-binding FadR family transcriptional regulator
VAKGRVKGATVAGKAPAPSHTVRVVDHLGESIVSGRLRQGDLLPGDQELLGEYGVSRTVLREALRTLSAKGLIRARARVGTRVQPRSAWNLFDSDVLRWHRVAGLDPDFLQHLAEVRMALEPEAAALAAVHRTAQDVEDIREWVRLMDKPDISHEDFAQADLGFHLAVAAAAGNPFFVSISTLIEVVLEAMLTISSPAANSQRHAGSVAKHRHIAEAIAMQDAAEARQAMQSVVREGIDAIRDARS